MNKNSISIKWCVEDIQGINPSLTIEECREVLQAAKYNHDASIGINWDVLQIHVDRILKNRK